MPYRIDLFAVFILLGIVQAVFLSFFFFSAENKKRQYNIFYGWLLISIAACLLEILLLYTGYAIHLLHLVDFSEFFGLLIGPLLYLYIVSLAEGSKSKKVIWMHLAFPIIYLVFQTPFLISSADVKYNAWIGAYHPDLPFRPANFRHVFGLTEWHTELVLVSLAVYVTASGFCILRSFRNKNESFFKPITASLVTMRNSVLQFAFFTVMIVVVKLFNKNDTGDHLFAAVGSLLIYLTSFALIRESGFFKRPALNEQLKYKSSSLTEDQQKELLEKLQQLMNLEKPFIQSDFSQPDLAHQLGVSVHILSQAINDGLGKNFFEMIAEYRVEEAKKLLIEKMNIKVEEIAEQVGYNSKSSFNTAFKKITGVTPSQFREHNVH